MDRVSIEHAALSVCDLEGAKAFFCRYFGAAANAGYHNAKTDFRSYFLTFAGGARLELQTRPGLAAAESAAPEAAGWAHLAFAVGSREEVDRRTADLAAGGWIVVSGPRMTGDGYYESCVRGFEGCLLELTV